MRRSPDQPVASRFKRIAIVAAMGVVTLNIWTGAPLLGLWVAVEKRTDQPLAHIPTLLDPPVAMTNLVTLFVGFGMFGSFLLIPQLAEAPESTGYGFGLDATGAGLLMLPGALLMLVAGPVSGTLGTRFGSKLPLTLGAGFTSVGLLAMGLWMLAWRATHDAIRMERVTVQRALRAAIELAVAGGQKALRQSSAVFRVARARQ